uniref:Uncharacterized protein n=1 Tax=Brassica campestris TaxID=3711 RepID=A0A3P6D370_BRACM|nr:unnamed protein product [Brassica rapa]
MDGNFLTIHFRWWQLLCSWLLGLLSTSSLLLLLATRFISTLP